MNTNAIDPVTPHEGRFLSRKFQKNVNTNAIDPVTRLMRAVFVVEISKKNVNTNAISSFLSPHPTFLTPHSSFLSFMVLVGLKWSYCTTYGGGRNWFGLVY